MHIKVTGGYKYVTVSDDAITDDVTSAAAPPFFRPLWESLESVQRYTRSFSFQDSMKFYKSPLN